MSGDIGNCRPLAGANIVAEKLVEESAAVVASRRAGQLSQSSTVSAFENSPGAVSR